MFLPCQHLNSQHITVHFSWFLGTVKCSFLKVSQQTHLPDSLKYPYLWFSEIWTVQVCCINPAHIFLVFHRLKYNLKLERNSLIYSTIYYSLSHPLIFLCYTLNLVFRNKFLHTLPCASTFFCLALSLGSFH